VHFSVQEYIVGSQLLKVSSTQSRLQLRDVHRFVAKECLAYLYLSRDIGLEHALIKYAIEHWQMHSVVDGDLDERTRRDAFLLSESTLSGEISTLDDEFLKYIAHLAQWPEDRERIRGLISILRAVAKSEESWQESRKPWVGDLGLVILYPDDPQDPMIRCSIRSVPLELAPLYEVALNTNKAVINDNDDDISNSNFSTDKTPPPTHHRKKRTRHLNTIITPEPESMLGLFLGLTIATVLGMIFLNNGEEGFFITLVLFVLTIFVPFCWSSRIFTCCIASYLILAAASSTLAVVVLIFNLAR
jgi:hypothetical protein